LLQVLDDGQLTDSLGRKVDFKNTLIIMTSNVGTRDLKSTSGYGFGEEKEKDKYDHMKDTVHDALKKLFNPEFLNRVDETIVFRSLDKDDIKQIIKIEMKDLLKSITEKHMQIVLQSKKDLIQNLEQDLCGVQFKNIWRTR
jgi:ATP-dependent Clp protease ATP-binding subunit ClpC